MREILFRAKHIHILPQNEHLDGIWVYGYLCDENHINTIDQDEYGGNFTSEMLIDPSTVCQYTGLTDKNGRKIFEGDILSAHIDVVFPESITYAYVIWEEFSWCVRESSNVCDFDEILNEWYREKFEICGNVFDNPDLIKNSGMRK